MNREGRDYPILPLARLDEITLDYLKKTHSQQSPNHWCSCGGDGKGAEQNPRQAFNRRRDDPESAGPENLSLVAEEFVKIREEEEDVV